MATPVQRSIERYSIFILDPNVKKSPDYVQACDQLRTLVDTLKTFSNQNECVDAFYNSSDDNQRIILIISANLGEHVIPAVDGMSCLDRVYIISAHPASHQSWIERYPKLKENVISHVSSIFERVTTDLRKSDDERMAISYISRAEIRGGNRQDPSFMYNQLIKEILLNDTENDSEEIARQQMIDYCRETYSNNVRELRIIDEFEQHFFPEHCFYWYTRDCFLHKVLNRALWIPEPHVLYKLRYFIRHLHEQISIVGREQTHLKKSMTVYRGQTLPKDEFNLWKNGIGGLLSFNNFLSTSLDRNVALIFTEDSVRRSDRVSIVFCMKIDSKLGKCPFLSIGDMGFFLDKEREVLFSMGTVFRIEEIQQSANDQWEIKLSLSEDSDANLAHYTAKMRGHTCSKHPLIGLIRLMDELGQCRMLDEFEAVYAEDRSIRQHEGLTAAVEHALGSAYLAAGNPDKALKMLSASLEKYLKLLPEHHPSLSPTYNNIGSVYYAMKDFPNALEYHQLALNCQLKASEPNIDSIVTYSTNIASVYQYLELYDEALIHLNKALEMQKNFLGENHPDLSPTYVTIARLHSKKQEHGIATSYSNRAKEINRQMSHPDPDAAVQLSMTAAQTCLAQKQYVEAIDHFHNVLEIQQQFLLPNNPALATTYNAIARAYFQQKKFQESIPYYQKAIEIEKKAFADDHPTIALTYYNMSTALLGMSKYEEALESANDALHQCKKRSNPEPSALRRYLCHIGHVLHKQGEHAQAIVYLERSLAVPDSDPNDDDDSMGSLAVVYHSIGSAYYEMKKFPEALSCYQKTLQIELRALSHDDPTIAVTYTNISTALQAMSRHDDALKYAHEGVKQLRKKDNPDPSLLAKSLHQVGCVLKERKQYTEAIQYFKQGLDVLLLVVDDYHQSIAAIFYNIGECYSETGDTQEAISYYRKTLQIEQQSLPDDHPTIAVTQFKISINCHKMSRYDDALKYAQDSVEQLRKCPYPDENKLSKHLLYTGKLLHKLNKPTEALQYYEQGLALNEGLLNDDDESSASFYHNIGSLYYKMNKFAEALSYYQKTLEIELRLFSDDAPTIATTYSNMATAYVGLEQYDDAMVACQEAIDQLLKTHPPDDENVTHQRVCMENVRKKQLIQMIYKS